jgi:hypothetical protein
VKAKDREIPDIAAVLGRTAQSVKSRTRKQGFDKLPDAPVAPLITAADGEIRGRWTADENAKRQEMKAERRTYKEIANVLGRTTASVASQIQRTLPDELKTRKRSVPDPAATPPADEDTKLQKMGADRKTHKETAAVPGRTESSTNNKASRKLEGHSKKTRSMPDQGATSPVIGGMDQPFSPKAQQAEQDDSSDHKTAQSALSPPTAPLKSL